MDEVTLSREFDRAVSTEPALGFDPDDIVNRAARGRRMRRNGILTGSAVAIVLTGAIAVPLAVRPAHSAAAAAPVLMSTVWPVPGGPVATQPTDAEINARSLLAQRELLTKARALWPHLAWASVDDAGHDVIDPRFGDGVWVYGATVSAPSGHGTVIVNVTVLAPPADAAPISLTGRCAPGVCELSRRPDGDAVYVSLDPGAVRSAPGAAHLFPEQLGQVVDLRTDNTEVRVTMSATHGANPGPVGDGLRELATGPGFPRIP